jgi:hypothetical protein
MTLRQSGCLAAALCVLSAWGVIIAVTWESKAGAAVCGVFFLAGIALLVAHARRVRTAAQVEEQANEIRLREAAGPVDRANKSDASRVMDEDSQPGGAE